MLVLVDEPCLPSMLNSRVLLGHSGAHSWVEPSDLAAEDRAALGQRLFKFLAKRFHKGPPVKGQISHVVAKLKADQHVTRHLSMLQLCNCVIPLLCKRPAVRTFPLLVSLKLCYPLFKLMDLDLHFERSIQWGKLPHAW